MVDISSYTVTEREIVGFADRDLDMIARSEEFNRTCEAIFKTLFDAVPVGTLTGRCAFEHLKSSCWGPVAQGCFPGTTMISHHFCSGHSMCELNDGNERNEKWYTSPMTERDQPRRLRGYPSRGRTPRQTQGLAAQT